MQAVRTHRRNKAVEHEEPFRLSVPTLPPSSTRLSFPAQPTYRCSDLTNLPHLPQPVSRKLPPPLPHSPKPHSSLLSSLQGLSQKLL